MLKELKKAMSSVQLRELATDGLKTRDQLPSTSSLRRLAIKIAKRKTGTWGDRLRSAWALVYTWIKKHIQGRSLFSDMADAWLYPELTRMRQVAAKAAKMLAALWEQVCKGFFPIDEYKKLEESYGCS